MGIIGILKRRREAARISQAQVATACGVTPGNVSRWETGDVDPPLSKVLAYADLVGMAVELRHVDLTPTQAEAVEMLLEAVTRMPDRAALTFARQAQVAAESEAPPYLVVKK